ncbi:MAG: nucleoside hydrolase [Candidatus Eremiobacterota bacterium]
MSDETGIEAKNTRAGRRVILDTDIGTDIDDAMALALLLACPEYKLEGCTAAYIPESCPGRGDRLSEMFGHRLYPLKFRRLQILRKLLDLAGAYDIKAITGTTGLFKREGRIYWNGYEGWNLPCNEYDPSLFDNISAEDYIIGRVSKHPSDIDIISIGPMTNIARAFEKNPEVMSLVNRIIFMGGHIEGEKEHNFSSDPEAVEKVFQSDVPLVMVGAEITRKTAIRSHEIEILERSGSFFGRAVTELLHTYIKRFDRDWTYMHDPFTVFVAVNSNHMSFEEIEVTVKREGRIVPGRGRKILRLMEKDGIFEDFNSFLVKRLETHFKYLQSKNVNMFVSGSGLKGEEELCRRTAEFLYRNRANYIYGGSDTGRAICNIYKKLEGEKHIYHNIFEFRPSMKDFKRQNSVNHHQMVYNRNSDMYEMRRQTISLAHTVICLGGGKGSKEEEIMAKEFNKKILYVSSFED